MTSAGDGAQGVRDETPEMVAGDGYLHVGHGLADHHAWLLPTLAKYVEAAAARSRGRRAFDLGCGNGSIAEWLSQKGWEVSGVDPSKTGISAANATYPRLHLEAGSCYDDLAARYGQFDLVVSLEVVEHLFFPRIWARRIFELLAPGGTAILSTPFHGYWKNLALAVTGKLDAHFCALWDYGHIKFWSVATFDKLLSETGLDVGAIERVGRVPLFAKSMVAIANRPAGESVATLVRSGE